MTRFEIVAATVGSEMAKPYAYGKSDCFFFGLSMADALDRKLDLVKTYAGSYTTLMGAQRALRKQGFGSLADLFKKHLEPCAPAMARIGDVVVLQMADGEHVGVCLGRRFVTKTAAGRIDVEIDAVKAAYRAG